jgi:hypothetical protein
MTQGDFFGLLEPKPVAHPADKLLIMPGSRGPRAQIELRQCRESGRWMWATAYRLATSGAGYQAGPAWGRFAATRNAALRRAVDEQRGLLAWKTCDIAGQIRRWLNGLQADAVVAV